MSKKWASYTFSLFLYKPRKKRKTSPKPLAPMDGRENQISFHKCGEEMSKNSSLPNQEQQEQVSWMARAGEREGDKGAKEFCPGWSHQPGQKSLASLCPSLPPSEPFNSLVLTVLGSGEGSSCSFLHHNCEKIFDSPVHPSALKVLGLFFSSSLACIAHFIL